MADDRDARIAQLEAELRQARRQIESLSESLMAAGARETALADIARTITSSPADAQPTLDAIVHSAKRLSGSTHAALSIR